MDAGLETSWSRAATGRILHLMNGRMSSVRCCVRVAGVLLANPSRSNRETLTEATPIKGFPPTAGGDGRKTLVAVV
jgi:hypothetical protein